MKKVYNKPQIQIEEFEMDIEVLQTVEMGSELYNQLYFLYTAQCAQKQENPTDQGFDAFVKAMGHDTPTSGLCYFTPTQPS